jgi:hypothetical protein
MTLKEKSLGAQLRRWRQLRCLLGLSTWGVAVVVMVVVLRQRQSLGMLPGKRQWLTWMLGCLVCGILTAFKNHNIILVLSLRLLLSSKSLQIMCP